MSLKKSLDIDFLIVGASKSGTTALASFLNQNDEVFICDPKEPKFLTYSFLKDKYKGPGDDITLKNCIKSFEEYQQLFLAAPKGVVKGEASVDLLYHHKESIPEIKKQLDNPKIIIMLREQSKRAFSAYSHLIRDERESQSFSEALALEEERLQKDYEFIWAYKNEGLYYEPVKEFISNFDNVKVVFFEEFIRDQLNVVNDVFNFLGVNPLDKLKVASQNKSGKPKSKLINRFFIKDSFLKSIFKSVIGTNTRNRVKTFIQSKNLSKIEADKQTLENLKKEYLKDNAKLAELLNKELSIWN
jgi:hypothetical protein